MARIFPLRTRVTLLYTLMGFILSVLFAGAVVFIAEDYEHVLVEEILNSQGQDYAARLVRAPDTDLPRTNRLSAYLRRPDGTGEVPAALALLPPGIHESDLVSEDGIHMAVFDTTSGRLYFTINLKDIEELEKHLSNILMAVIVLGTLISAWLGWLLSGVVMLPIQRLADAVERLPTRPMQTSLGRDMPRDELGRLGIAIDEYQARLVSAEQAERAFFADASHELRTPISVVRGATELLLEDGEDVPGMRPRLLRLDRGMRELSELLDALLRVARRGTGETEQIILREWLGECLAGADSIKDGTVRLSIHGDDGTCQWPASDAALVVRSVARRLLPPGLAGLLEVAVSSEAIEFRFVADGRPQVPVQARQPRPSDRRLGLTLVGRLAEQLDWHIDDRQAESGHTVIRFTPSQG